MNKAKKLDQMVNLEIQELIARNSDKYFKASHHVSYEALRSFGQAYEEWDMDDMPPPFREQLTKLVARELEKVLQVRAEATLHSRDYTTEGFVLSRIELQGLLMAAFNIGITTVRRFNFNTITEKPNANN